MGILDSNSDTEISVGSIAPEFGLMDQNSQSHLLSNYRGKWVLLYFYPKDDTPGCTKEACHFRDDIASLKKINAQILGVSLDNEKSHAKFAQKYTLPFPLLADTDGKVAKSYGSLTSLGPLKFAKRHTFIIDPNGKVARVYRTVKPATHSNEIIAAITELSTSK